MINNKMLGNRFEAEFCQMLFKDGFWVLNVPQSNVGQPADIIAVRSDKAFLIDCKVCSSKGFDLERVEPNQWTAMELWDERTTTIPLFAMKLTDGSVWIVSFSSIKQWNEYRRIVSEKMIREVGHEYKDWVQAVCVA